MTIIKTRDFEVTGILCGFEERSDGLVFMFSDKLTEVYIKRPSPEILNTLNRVGLIGCKNIEIDFRINKITMIPPKV